MKTKKDGTISRQGEGGGKPSKYPTEELAYDKLSGYLKKCEDEKSMPNKAGACVFLSVDKSTYNDYKKKYPHTFKGFENIVESAWVQRLGGNSPTGAIFYLKNAFREDWKDKHETELNGTIKIEGNKIAFAEYGS